MPLALMYGYTSISNPWSISLLLSSSPRIDPGHTVLLRKIQPLTRTTNTNEKLDPLLQTTHSPSLDRRPTPTQTSQPNRSSTVDTRHHPNAHAHSLIPASSSTELSHTQSPLLTHCRFIEPLLTEVLDTGFRNIPWPTNYLLPVSNPPRPQLPRLPHRRRRYYHHHFQHSTPSLLAASNTPTSYLPASTACRRTTNTITL